MAARWVRHFLRQPEDESWQQSGLYRFSSFMLSVQHLLVIACGASWLIKPSNSIDVTLSPAWSGSWSLLFVVFAVVAYIARLRRTWPIEAACNIVIAISVWLWAMVVLVVTVTGDGGGLQTGFMLLAFAANLWGWSVTQLAWVRRRESEGARMQRLVVKLLAEEREKAEQEAAKRV